ncbi:PREDICTED: CDK5 regulatory subunit-associated protein 3 [Ficedula albicollis]|uniref:CDK5 regulatory subunit-associated protein 3 n=1 Tax=Ficedula albicollis TaxID=59894 RepID=UPI0007AD8E78|nr:PREDICTED: CDK5 regulatory subunit-associated protein 3 [Ficedula albicollis]
MSPCPRLAAGPAALRAALAGMSLSPLPVPMSPCPRVPVPMSLSPCPRVPDWLLDRRHCGRRWQAQVQAVRQRMQAALQDMPEHPEIRELLRGSFLHYFHCLRIVEILKGTEASTKNLFGRYSSQRMKDWQEIVSLYEKENAYLGEGGTGNPTPQSSPSRGRTGTRVSLWCPRGVPSVPSVSQGEDVRRELLAQVQALPSLLSRVGDGASALGDAIELYEASVAFVCDRWGQPDTPKPPQNCPDTTEPPGDPGGPRRAVWGRGSRGGFGALFPQIDWGDFPAEPPQGGDSDWGITVEPSPQGDDGIDWGDGEKGTVTAEPGAQDGIDWGDGEKGTVTAEPSAQGDDGIDWGDGGGQEGTITVLEAGAEAPEDVGTLRAATRGTCEWPPEEPAGGPAPHGGGPGGDPALSPQLELFLAQRLLEMEDEADVVAMSQLQLAPAVLQGQSSERVRALLATTRELLAQLCSRSVQHLCMILASPRCPKLP